MAGIQNRHLPDNQLTVSILSKPHCQDLQDKAFTGHGAAPKTGFLLSQE